MSLSDASANLARASFRHPAITLALALLVSIGAMHGARRMVLDTDVTTLLPETFPSVQALDMLRERFGGVGFVALLASGNEPEGLKRFADEIAPRLEKLDTVASVDARRPVEFFRERVLYFFDVGDLESMAERLEERHAWEVAERNPLFVRLDDERPPSLDFDDIEQKYRARLEDSTGGAYHTDTDGRRLVVLVRPTELASDLSFTRRVVAQVEAEIASLDAARYGDGFSVEVTGRYKKRTDLQQLVQEDLSITGIVAALLAGLYLLLHFRRLSSLIVVLFPLALSILWTYGFAGLTLGTLSLLTAFIGTLLVGFGIDSGIHLSTAYYEAAAQGYAGPEAIHTAYRSRCRGIMAATLTTTGAFFCVAMAELRAFREFGIIAAAGVVLAVIAYHTCLPALLRILPSGRTRETPARPMTARLVPWAPVGFWTVLIGVFMLAAHQLHAVRFNYDFADLDRAQLRSYDLDREVNDILGRSQTPLVVAGDDQDDLAASVAAVRQRRDELGEASTIAEVVSLASFVPDEQEAKRPLLERIHHVATQLLRGDVTDDARKNLEDLVSWSAHTPFGAADLPPEVRRIFRPAGAGGGEIALIYPRVSMSDGRSAERLAAELGYIERADGETVAAAGEAIVLSDVIVSVRQDAAQIGPLVLVVVGLLLWITLGTLRGAFVVGLSATLSVAAALAIAACSGLQINYLNLLVFPILIGTGVDGGAYLVARRTGGESLEDLFGHAWRPVCGALITTMLGFLALCLARHPGLSSVGVMGLIGFAANLVMGVVFVPSALGLAAVTSGKPAMLDRAAAVVSNVGGAGLIPRGGGTLGALLAVPIAGLLAPLPLLTRVAGGLGVVWVGVYVARRYMRDATVDDPQEIVLDELAGCLVTLTFVPFEPLWVLLGFAAFRLLDIFKPGPIAWVEQRWSGARGVMLDDLAAGLVAGGGLALAHQLLA